MNVELVPAAGRLADWLRNGYPLYLHDLSAFTDYYHLDGGGRWVPDYLPDWLAGSALQRALIIVADGEPAGFAFVGVAPFVHMTPGLDFRMCEFFVLHPYRRRGVGRAAALAAFGLFRGTWEVTEVERNAGAIAFWRTVIGAYTNGNFVDGPGTGEQIQTFSNR